MSTIQLTHETPSIDDGKEIPVQIGHAADPILGFARVIAQVNTNVERFGGWGPKVLM